MSGTLTKDEIVVMLDELRVEGVSLDQIGQ